MDDLLVTLQEYAALYGLRVIAALAILIIGRVAAGVVRSLLKRALLKGHVEGTLVSFVSHLVYAALMAFVVIAALAKLGIQTASLIAVLAAVGLAVGLALQGSLANFAAGVLLIIFKPFKVGDYIEAGGAIGTVEEISIFTTELRSPDNKLIIIPNAKATGDNIVNHSAKEQRRVDLVASVSYSDDLDKVRDVLMQLLKEDTRVLEEPAPMVVVLEMADSSVNVGVRPWVRTEDYWGVFFDMQERIKKRFDAEGISIPFPQRDVHLSKQA